MRSGMVLELDRRVGEPVDIFVNNRLIARGEVVMVDAALGVTLTEIFRLAARMARDAGALVTMVDAPADALPVMRTFGAHLVLIDVEADVAGFLADLRAERILSPVIACGIDAHAERAVAAIRAGARDYLPLPPDRMLIAAVILTAAAELRVELIGEDPAFLRATSYGF
eukprot:gene43897-55269_t